MKFISAIALASFLLPAAFAAPAARDECHPNFAGRSVSIFPPSRSKEWGPGTLEDTRALHYKNPSSEVGEFKIPFTGEPDSSYFIKSVDAPANDFYAGIGVHSPYVVWHQSSSGSGAPWLISCTWCAPGDATFYNSTYATGCTLSSRGLCADETPYGSDDIPRINSCDGSPSQLWEFVLPRP